MSRKQRTTRQLNMSKRNRLRTIETLERREMMAVDVMNAPLIASVEAQITVCSVASNLSQTGTTSFPLNLNSASSNGRALPVIPSVRVSVDDTFDNPHDLGTLQGMQHHLDSVGLDDTADYYRFTLDDAENITLRLDHLAEDVDLYLYDASGNEIARSWRSGNASEQIDLSLSAGTYFALMTPWGTATSKYDLSLEVDRAGESFGTARDLGVVEGVREITDWVGQLDADDYFRFQVDDQAEVTLQLNQLSQDVDLYLYDESGNEISRSWLGSNADEQIQLELGPGTYFARVTPWDSANSNYHFSVDVDAAGEDFGTARDLGVVEGVREITDWVGQLDADDYFRFQVDDQAEVTLQLNQLSQDVDLYLYDESGNEISRSWLGSNADEQIQLELGPGTYFARVTPWDSANSNYHFSVDVDAAGEDFGTARDLGVVEGVREITDWVGQLDADDYFRFQVDDQAEVTLQLNQLSQDVDLYLYDESGNEISRSWLGSNADEQIQLELGPGTYFARVTPWDSANSNYHFSVDVDAAGEDFGTAHDLGVVEGVREITDWVGQLDADDYFRFQVDDQAEVTLQLNQLSQDVDLYLYDESGNEISRSWLGSNADEQIQLELGPGTYFARVTPWDSANSNYHFSVDVDAAGEDFGTARDLGVVEGVREITDWVGQLDADDYFRFQVDDQAEVTLQLNQLSQDVDLYLYDESGNEISRSWLGSNADEQIQLELGPGTYFARVTPWDSANSNYHFSVDVDAAGEDFGTVRDLGVVEGVREITDWVGQLDADDYFRFQVDDQAEVTLQLNQLSQDVDLYLYDESGNEISRSWLGSNADEQIQLELGPGTYFARVTPWDSANSNYHFSVDVDAAGEDFGTARDLGVVEGVREITDWVGQLDADDYFRFQVDDQAEVTLQLNQLSQDVDLYLYDESGNEISRSWLGSNADEQIQLELGPGTYFARVTPWDSANSNYHFSVDVDAAGEDFGTARDLGVVEGVREITDWVGQLDADDYFRFQVDDQAEVTLQLNQLSQDVDLYLYDESGNEISRSWLGSNADEQIQLRLDAGTYYVAVSPWLSNASTYHLAMDAALVDTVYDALPTVSLDLSVASAFHDITSDDSDSDDENSSRAAHIDAVLESWLNPIDDESLRAGHRVEVLQLKPWEAGAVPASPF